MHALFPDPGGVLSTALSYPGVLPSTWGLSWRKQSEGLGRLVKSSPHWFGPLTGTHNYISLFLHATPGKHFLELAEHRMVNGGHITVAQSNTRKKLLTGQLCGLETVGRLWC